MAELNRSSIRDQMKDFYGKKLQKTGDLKVQVCAKDVSLIQPVKAALKLVHPDVTERFYGCGCCIPECVEGRTVLDLGSGSGRDCFILSKLVGATGSVIGLDMTEELLQASRNYIDYHMDKFGYSSPNVHFVKGYIEELTDAGLKENSIDIIVSNCVVNLSAEKHAVLSEANKVLKPGGEIYFSDMYADRELPIDVKENKDIWGEGFSGALWWKELFTLAKNAGLSKPYLVTSSPIPIHNETIKRAVGDVNYAAATYRLFKLPSNKEKPAQVTYKGEIPGYKAQIKFDNQLIFKSGEAVTVNSEITTILKASRFWKEFDFQPVSTNCCNSTCCQISDPFELLKGVKTTKTKPETSCCTEN